MVIAVVCGDAISGDTGHFVFGVVAVAGGVAVVVLAQGVALFVVAIRRATLAEQTVVGVHAVGGADAVDGLVRSVTHSVVAVAGVVRHNTCNTLPCQAIQVVVVVGGVATRSFIYRHPSAGVVEGIGKGLQQSPDGITRLGVGETVDAVVGITLHGAVGVVGENLIISITILLRPLVSYSKVFRDTVVSTKYLINILL